LVAQDRRVTAVNTQAKTLLASADVTGNSSVHAQVYVCPIVKYTDRSFRRVTLLA
jgi:hypothetical protein